MKKLTALILVLFSILSQNAFSQLKSIGFTHLRATEGLSQSNVLSILQDSRGFMWFGTRDGLNKYDGYRFVVYKNEPNNPYSIGGNFISKIIESKTGDLWIATRGGGLSRYDHLKKIFINYKHDPRNPSSIANDYITAVAEDDNGNIWAGTESSGLEVLDPKTNKFTHYTSNPQIPGTVSDNFIRTIYRDREHTIWIGTQYGGLNRFDPTTKKFISFQHDINNESSISYNDVYSIFEDSRKMFWIGTNGGGLNLMNRAEGTFTSYKSDPSNTSTLRKNEVYDVNEDKDHKIWIGTENGGLSVLDVTTGLFKTYTHDDIDNSSIGNNSVYAICRDMRGNMWVGTFTGGVDLYNVDNPFIQYRHNSSPESLSDNKVLCIYEDNQKNIWVGTDGGGLNLFDPYKSSFRHFGHENENANSLCGDYVLSVQQDSRNNIWIGTWGDGISVYNPANNKFTHFKHDDLDSTSINSDYAWVIYRDKDGNMWVGTYGGGLELYDSTKNAFIHFDYEKTDPRYINNKNIKCLYDDGQGNLWIGTDGGGLSVMNKTTYVVKNVFTHSDKPNSICNNSVENIFEDDKGYLWFSTQAGLSRYDRRTNEFKNFTTENGLPNNVIFGILEDDKQNLWISTDYGISEYNSKTNNFKNYSLADGLQGNEFKEKAFCKSRSGAFYFGGNNGFNVFYPFVVGRQSFDPPLLMTSFKIFNQEVPIALNDDDKSPLKQNITETKSITIPYSSSVIQFEFASLNYTSNDKKQYSYILEGFDKTWSPLSTKRNVTYTNLDPGTYVFKVRGLNNDGTLSTHILRLQVIVTPPFWLTWWFKILVLLSLAGIITGFYYMRINNVKKQQKILETLVAERTQQLELSTIEERKARKEAEDASKAKSVFLATMSHEIRTPMNGVIGMASLLNQTELTSKQREYTDVIRVCGETLLNVINDILDFSKIESGNMTLEETAFDLRACIEEVMDMFSDKASKTNIDLVYKIDKDTPTSIVSDRLRLRQILINLISNALKFTKQGEVLLQVKQVATNKHYTELSFEVKDTGIGIPEDKLDRLFKSFSQVDSSTTRKYGGTGLGLIICQKLVHLMEGDISVQSKEGLGSTFTFTIKAKHAASTVILNKENNKLHLHGKKVLIVDDNTTNRTILIEQLLQWQMQTVPAASAYEALAILRTEQDFDLILTDMEMPGMNGIMFAQEVQKRLAGIPIILLSSLGDNSLNGQANLFSSVITKPIKQQALQSQIINALQQQQNAANQSTQETAEEEKLANKYPLRILLAEDDMFNQMVATQVLENLGYTATVASNGKKALECFETDKYDLVLMDIQMPVMDGYETTKQIRQTLQKQPVILAMTANAMDGDRMKCLQAGMDDYISKPIDLDELVNKLEKWAIHILSSMN